MAKNEAVKSIKFEGVSFNRSFLEGFESEGAFMEEMSGKTYAHLFEDADRDKKLKAVYAMVAKVEAPKAPSKVGNTK